ncbi:aminoglycoside phosphotransferase family protein [soil metagenome]
MTETVIDGIISQFNIPGKITSCKPYGSGHINDTYRLINAEGNDYLLQRINHYVFKDVPALMKNLVLVTRHLKDKLSAIPGANPDAETLTLVQCRDGSFYHEDAAGNYWRVFNFLSNTRSYDQVETTTQACEGGKAFGRFQYLLADIPPSSIIATIPRFHDIEYRLENLDKAIAADAAHKLSSIFPEIRFINERRTAMSEIIRLGRAGVLPQRIIHNDTKFNNVLLDKNDKAQCVIDLDTIMPGYVAYDFGDAIRTIINAAPEDEPELSKIQLNIPLFKAYVKGYLQQAGVFLTATEVSSLINGALLLPYMQGVRFLTDYLDGDLYFKIHSPGHNLQRARAQFELVRKLEAAKDELQGIIMNTWESLSIKS